MRDGVCLTGPISKSSLSGICSAKYFALPQEHSPAPNGTCLVDWTYICLKRVLSPPVVDLKSEFRSTYQMSCKYTENSWESLLRSRVFLTYPPRCSRVWPNVGTILCCICNMQTVYIFFWIQTFQTIVTPWSCCGFKGSWFPFGKLHLTYE